MDDTDFARVLAAQTDAFQAKVQAAITAQTARAAEFQAHMDAQSKELLALMQAASAPG